MFAIIETGGKQYKVQKGQKVVLEKHEGKEGTALTFDKVLLLNDEKTIKIGTPYISGASVSAKILSDKRGEKLITIKMKTKGRSKKTTGHRQLLTIVEITDIKYSEVKKEEKAKEKITEKTELKKKPKTTKKTKTI